MSMGNVPRWFVPSEGSWLDKVLAGNRRSKIPSDGFVCGLRAENANGAITDRWKYATSTVQGGTLTFGVGRRKPIRLVVRLVSSVPIDPLWPVRGDFLVWSAIELTSGNPLEIAASPRDAYRIVESGLLDSSG
ncbi:hypothetical protein ACSMXN_14600 [Jatrophihabitans sp. DSM 45814]